MQGLMQSYPLTLPHIFHRAERLFPRSTITSATATGVERTTYETWSQRTRCVGGALDALELSGDARVGTFAWNSARHLELYFAVPCAGRVLHTLNIRLFPDQLAYIINHAGDEVIFVDRSLVASLWPIAADLKTVQHYVVMDDGVGDVPDDPRIVDYETLLADASPGEFEVTDEGRAAAMCYTSGTTAGPKGVVYSHRSIFLQALGALLTDSIGISESDVLMPVVSMFHANGWGLPHAGVMAGANFVMPGSDLSPMNILDLIEGEGVTVTAGVPTVWMAVLPLLDGRNVASLRTILSGGSAVPQTLSEGFAEKIGVPLLHAWGMTETSPTGTVSRIKSTLSHLPDAEINRLRATQGLPLPCVDVRIVNPETNEEIAWDGEAFGELQVRGPWVAAAYYKEPPNEESFTKDGWLRTGDVATINPEGYVKLVDRTKDLVKSGGEWISSVQLENEIMSHPAVLEAAVIGVPHEKWGERPLACVVVAEEAQLTKRELAAFLEPKFQKWWLPDDVVFVDAIPKTSVGKFSKQELRQRYAGHDLQSGPA